MKMIELRLIYPLYLLYPAIYLLQLLDLFGYVPLSFF